MTTLERVVLWGGRIVYFGLGLAGFAIAAWAAYRVYRETF